MEKKKQNLSESLTEIVINNGTPEETIETSIDLPELNLVRMDMNIVEYPLFSKNKRRKINQAIRYKLNGRVDKYIEVKPSAGETIPGDFEEKVFIALISIMRKNNYSRNFAVTISEIANNMCVSSYTKKAIHNQIKSSLKKLSETSYTFKDSLYSSIKNELLSDTIITNIMSVRIISKIDVGEKERERYFKDGRVKEIYLISISQHFYDNIINKGYLVFDSNLLLNIGSSIARAIHMLITKLRFNDLKYKIGLVSLAGRIPLKMDKNNIGRSAKSIERACQELKNKNLIENFKIIKNGNWEKSEVEFYFTEEHNKIKQDNFYMEKDIFKGLYLNAQDINSENVSEEFFNSFHFGEKNPEENVEKILEVLPARAKQLKTIKTLIYNSIIQYGFERVYKSAIYTAEKNPTKIYGYLKKAIDYNYGVEVSLKKKEKEKKVSQLSLNNFENNLVIESYPFYEIFEKLSEEIQEKIYKEAIGEYTFQIKNNNSLKGKFKEMFIINAERQFDTNKKKFINDFLEKNKSKYEKFIKDIKIDNIKVTQEIDKNIKDNKINNSEKMIGSKDIKDYVTRSINNYSEIISLDKEKEKNLRKKISLKIVPLLNESDLPKNLIDDIIKEEVEKL